MSQFALLNACPFRPEDVKPGDFDFQAHLPVGKKTKKEKEKGKKNKRNREDSESEDHPSHDAGPSKSPPEYTGCQDSVAEAIVCLSLLQESWTSRDGLASVTGEVVHRAIPH